MNEDDIQSKAYLISTARIAGDLATVSSACLGVARSALRPQRAAKQPLTGSGLVEHACLLIYEQILTLAEAGARLAIAETEPTPTCAPYTVFGRLTIEGVAYLNYILSHNDPQLAARRYIMSDPAWREKYNDHPKRWRRYHGRRTANPNKAKLTEHSLVLQEADTPSFLDPFEWNVLRECFGRLHQECGDIQPAWVSRYRDAETCRELRSVWNSLGDELTGTSLGYWETSNQEWNALCIWPAGVSFWTAVEVGRLRERVCRMLDESPPAGSDPLGSKRLWWSWVEEIGYGVMSQLAHFSSSRVIQESNLFSGTVLTVLLTSTLLATRILPNEGEWTSTVKNALDDGLRRCQAQSEQAP